MTLPFRIATRGSRLALRQANHVAEALRPILAPRPVELVEVKTTGDQARDVSLQVIGGRGVFTKEIQEAVLAGRADLAVHSLKDLPTEPAPGLVLAAVPERGPTADVLISRRGHTLAALPDGAAVATGSARRRAQLLHYRPDLKLVDIRGNVETRLRKLDDQGLDGLILALAGLDRLGLSDRVTEVIHSDVMLPAVGQGALGLECRDDNSVTVEVLRRVNHVPSYQMVMAERSFLRALGGGCLLPIAALATVGNGQLLLRGAVLSPDGRERRGGELCGSASLAEGLGVALAQQLIREGALALLSI